MGCDFLAVGLARKRETVRNQLMTKIVNVRDTHSLVEKNTACEGHGETGSW